MNVFEEFEALSGIEQLRALIKAGRRPPIFDTLGFDLAEIEPGRAVLTGAPGPKVYNPLGSVHGGYGAAMLDSACGCACHSKLAVGQLYTTLELKIAYHKAMTADIGQVEAVGTLLSFGRRVAFAEAKLTGKDGKLYVSATSTLLIFERPSA